MSRKPLTLVTISDRAPMALHRRPETMRLARPWERVRAIYRILIERARERRRARETAAALERLTPRELRDIGVVRLHDTRETRYVRSSQGWN